MKVSDVIGQVDAKLRKYILRAEPKRDIDAELGLSPSASKEPKRGFYNPVEESAFIDELNRERASVSVFQKKL